MSDILVIVINILYLGAAQLLLNRIDFPFLRKTIWSYAWATLFIASIFFVLGLFLFDIPLGILGYNNPKGLKWLKSVWWFYPVGFLILTIISISLRVHLKYLKNELKRRKAKSKLLIASMWTAFGVVSFYAMISLREIQLDDHAISVMILFGILWMVTTIIIFWGTIGLKFSMRK